MSICPMRSGSRLNASLPTEFVVVLRTCAVDVTTSEFLLQLMLAWTLYVARRARLFSTFAPNAGGALARATKPAMRLATTMGTSSADRNAGSPSFHGKLAARPPIRPAPTPTAGVVDTALPFRL
jgi:hypothetical protein